MGLGSTRSWRRGLERPSEGRLVAGVCAGLAERFQLDVTLVRLAAVLLGLASGIGLLFYILLWLVIPDGSDDRPPWRSYRQRLGWSVRGMRIDIQRAWDAMASAWSRTDRTARWPRPLSRRWVAVGLIALGTLILLQSLGFFAWLGLWRCLGLAIIAVGVSVLVHNAYAWRNNGEKTPDRW